MSIKRTVFISLFLIQLLSANAQNREIKLDFEDRPATAAWWKDNNQVKFSLDERKKNQYTPSSDVCLHLRWDSIPTGRKNVWFTDLKIDSLANPVMNDVRRAFGSKIWLSFWCNTGNGDTLWVQPLLLTRGHKGKWGAKKRTPISSSEWVFLKFNLAELEYSKWGKGSEVPNLKSDEIRCFEVGLLNGNNSPKGFIDARFDDVMISNYEPFAGKKKNKK
jgi:hypothetical protein